MASPSELLQEKAAWAIGNIAGDCVELRDQVLAQGAGAALLRLVASTRSAAVAQHAWFALSNCLRGQNAPTLEFYRNGLNTSIMPQ